MINFKLHSFKRVCLSSSEKICKFRKEILTFQFRKKIKVFGIKGCLWTMFAVNNTIPTKGNLKEEKFVSVKFNDIRY